jgi:hypothetical protein
MPTLISISSDSTGRTFVAVDNAGDVWRGEVKRDRGGGRVHRVEVPQIRVRETLNVLDRAQRITERGVSRPRRQPRGAAGSLIVAAPAGVKGCPRRT